MKSIDQKDPVSQLKYKTDGSCDSRGNLRNAVVYRSELGKGFDDGFFDNFVQHMIIPKQLAAKAHLVTKRHAFV